MHDTSPLGTFITSVATPRLSVFMLLAAGGWLLRGDTVETAA